MPHGHSMLTRAAQLAALIALSGCIGGGSATNHNTLIYAQPDDPKTLDPINTDIAEATHVITNIFDTLVTYDEETTEIVPALAERWELSADGLTWTFHLRTGVTFHDGTLCNATAVKTSLDRLIRADHPLLFDKARPYQSAYEMIRDVAVADDGTVLLRLHHPSAVLLANLAMFPASIVSPAALAKYHGDFAEHPVGTGPYQVVKWHRDQQLVCSAFAGHWRGRPKIDQLIWVPVKENATRVQRLQRGEIHVAENLTPIELDDLATDPQLVVQEQTGTNVAYLSMQMENRPLNDLRVRRAIYTAIDKAALVKLGYAGHATPAVSMVPPMMWGHDDSLVDLPYDPAQARQLLQEASVDAGFNLPLSLTLAVMNQARPYLQQPVAIQGYLKDALREIGIEVRIEARDVNQHFEHLSAGRHQLGLAGWSTDNSDPDNFLYSMLDPDNISASGNNLSRYRNPRFHELMLAGQRETNPTARLPIYLEAQRLVQADLPVVPLVHTRLRSANVKRLKGYRLHPTGLVRLRTAYFEESTSP
jgi:peptide/nickel transport system substrate-binding protein